MKKFFSLLLLLNLLSAIKLDEATYVVGQRYYQQGLYTEAEKRFLEVIRKFPDSPRFRESLYYLGCSYAAMGNDKAALQYYKLLLNKADTVKEKQSALLGIAKSWLQIGVYDKAAEFYSFFASEYPQSTHTPGALYYAGIARERENNIPAAIEKYRQIFELYPGSDYQAKAIEKVAVLDQNTPESLFTTPKIPVAKKPPSTFPDEDNINASDIPSYNSPPLRTQNISDQILNQFQPLAVHPAVITQIIQSPPIILTQTVQEPPITITQTVDVPAATTVPKVQVPSRSLPEDIQYMIDKDIVILSNGRVVQETPEEAAKIARYRSQWEAEQKQKESELKLSTASNTINKMLDLTDNKASLLGAKEAALAEKRNKLQAGVYSSLNTTENLKPVLPYKGVQKANTNTNTNTNTVEETPKAAESIEIPVAAELPVDNIYKDEANITDENMDDTENVILEADIDEEAVYNEEDTAYNEDEV